MHLVSQPEILWGFARVYRCAKHTYSPIPHLLPFKHLITHTRIHLQPLLSLTCQGSVLEKEEFEVYSLVSRYLLLKGLKQWAGGLFELKICYSAHSYSNNLLSIPPSIICNIWTFGPLQTNNDDLPTPNKIQTHTTYKKQAHSSPTFSMCTWDRCNVL